MKGNEKDWLSVAARQHGAIGHGQLLAAGLSRRQVERRVSSGVLERVHRGVFRVAATTPSLEQAAVAACLATGGVASHRCAAALWGLRGCGFGLIEVTVTGRRRPALDGVVGHTTSYLPAVDVTERSSVPVTTAARTLLDLAAVAPALVVEHALEDAFHRHLVSHSWLSRMTGRPSSRSRPSTGTVMGLLADRDPALEPTESVLEDELVRLLRSAGLPDPVRQHPVPGPQGQTLRLDISYPPDLVAIEGQSRIWHSGRQDLQKDCDKRNLLVRMGWRVLVFTWHDVRERPDMVVATVRAALGR